MSIEVRRIDAATHLGFVQGLSSASFLQLPSWAGVKAEWGSQSIGWYSDSNLIGVGLVLTRQVPRLKAFLAYLPEGPVLAWDQARFDSAALLKPMLDYLSDAGAFMVKMGPAVPVRTWSATTLKEAIASGDAARLRDVPPDTTHASGTLLIESLQAAGWTRKSDDGAGFGDVQPRYVFQIPLADRTEDELLKSFNQLWRRNIKKATKSGVAVRRGNRDNLAIFHPLYVETAERDGFIPRGLPYFQRMWDAMANEDPHRIRLYIAEHEGRALASTTMVEVGNHAWYSYGASSNAGRDVKPSNAIQWQMMRDCLAEGKSVYDMRGISDTLDADDPLFGLIRFKLGTGGQAVEYVGEWDFALRPTLAKAFQVYLARGTIKQKIKKPFQRKETPTK